MLLMYLLKSPPMIAHFIAAVLLRQQVSEHTFFACLTGQWISQTFLWADSLSLISHYLLVYTLRQPVIKLAHSPQDKTPKAKSVHLFLQNDPANIHTP